VFHLVCLYKVLYLRWAPVRWCSCLISLITTCQGSTLLPIHWRRGRKYIVISGRPQRCCTRSRECWGTALEKRLPFQSFWDQCYKTFLPSFAILDNKLGRLYKLGCLSLPRILCQSQRGASERWSTLVSSWPYPQIL